ncbi:MAG: erythromycin esterase family protein [Pseudonocardiaceae bacterium]
MYPSPGRRLRNEVLAENLRWVLDHEDRVVVGAHNVHLQRSPRRRILTIHPAGSGHPTWPPPGNACQPCIRPKTNNHLSLSL